MDGLAETIADLQKDAFQTARASRGGEPDDFSDVVMGFYHAVRWNEPFVVGLLVMHAVLLVTVVLVRGKFKTNFVLFLCLCATVRASEMINTYLGRNWRELNITQNYFDPHGVFMGVMFAGPLLVILTLQAILAVCQAGNLLVAVKREELKRGKRPAKGKPGEGDSAPETKKEK